MTALVLKHKRTTLERAEKFISTRFFKDVNLRGRLYPQSASVSNIKHYAAPDRIPYSKAVQAQYTDTTVGTKFGPSWTTHWFQLEIDIPSAWIGKEVHLLWTSDSEALVWKDGKPTQGLNTDNDRRDYIISKNVSAGDLKERLYVEMACNGLFGTGIDSLIGPADPNKQFVLSQCEIKVFDRDVFELILDFEILIDMVKHLPDGSNRGYQALYTANEMVNVASSHREEDYQRAKAIAKEFFSQGNGASQHVICAIGNCHIDSAWLWPYAETIRKCARSFCTTIKLMQDYNFYFACSQAQQYEWVKEHYPSLYEDMRALIKEGRFIPVGGVWIEMDGNLPSGEGFVRQFLYGQRYFEKEFGIRCKEFWLPDTFGYSGQLPQIMQLSGITRFVTQKMSWNLVNKFPHHTFWWEGIDGSKVLTHFPPGECYTMSGTVKEVVKTVNNFEDKGRSNHSMFLFGHGDGGQGPSDKMLERLERMKDIDGLPKIEMTTPDDYFNRVEKSEAGKLCKWIGELYLELHNGTYTTQAKTKMYNRKCEFLLQDVEKLATLSWVLGRNQAAPYRYPSEELLRLWKLLLLNQFHDVLPGSSINMVYKDALEYYRDIEKSGNSLYKKGLEQLLCQSAAKAENQAIVVNTQAWEREGVVSLGNQSQPSSPAHKRQKTSESSAQMDSCGNTLVLVKAPSFGYSVVTEVQDEIRPVVISKGEDGLTYLANEYIRASIDPWGRIVSLGLQDINKEAISAGCYGNQFVIYDDVPLYWDAWDVMDYHMETRQPLEEFIQQAKIVEEGPLRGAIEVSLKISDKSYLKQTISLDARSSFLKFTTEVHWHEDHKFLKVEFPANVRSAQATYEIQFGHLQRPTTQNTSWETAKFEVCGHKWADISEHDWGLSVLNDSKYGWSCVENTLRLSLLRSPKAPDEKADMGVHTFSFAVMPHTGTFQEAGVIQQAYNLNCPLVVNSVTLASAAPSSGSYFSLDTQAVVLDTVKKCEDEANAFIVRLYEAFGGQCAATLTTTLPVKRAVMCNAIEDQLPGDDVPIEDGSLQLSFTPFQIVSVMLFI